MNIRMQLKNKFNQVNDPILQRGDQYVNIFLNKFKKLNGTKPPKTNYPKQHHLALSEYEVTLLYCNRII